MVESEYVSSEEGEEEVCEESTSTNERNKKSSPLKPKDFGKASDSEKRKSEYQLAYLSLQWSRLSVIIPTLVTLLIAVGLLNWVPRLIDSIVQESKTNLISESEFNSLISIFIKDSSQIEKDSLDDLSDNLEARKYYAAIKSLDNIIDGTDNENFTRKGNLTYFRALTKLVAKEYAKAFEDFQTAYGFYREVPLRREATIRNTVVAMVMLKNNGFANENDYSFINEAKEYVEITNIQWKFPESED